MPRFACAYGHVMRISDKVADEKAAAINTFGVTSRVTVISYGNRAWRYLTNAERIKVEAALKAKHFEQTGNVITSS